MPAQPGSRGDYSHIPIPSYEEAVTSRPSSSQNFLGPSEVSNDAEREGLLGRAQDDGGPSSSSSPFRGYRAPTVESARSSIDDVDNLVVDDDDQRSARESMEELRREMSEMEFEDAPARNKWSTRLSSLNLNLQFSIPSRIRQYIPARSSLPTWSGVRGSLRPALDLWASCRCDFTVVIRVMAFVFVMISGYLVFFSNTFAARRPIAHSYDPDSVRKYIIEHTNEGRIRGDLYYITTYDHIAGTEGSYVLGKWIENQWHKMRLGPVEEERFDVYINYPRVDGRRVYIVEPNNNGWNAKIEEQPVYDEGTKAVEQTSVWHGHSRTGNATGHLIYANYGSKDDLEKLKSLGVKLEGSIVLVRNGALDADAKLKNAEESGAVGLLTYSDPADQEPGAQLFHGKWRADGAVQRDAVSHQAFILGDVLTPGYASTQQEKNRIGVDKARDLGYLPKIPSLPIAWHEDAKHLLNTLRGAGKKLDESAPSFVGGVPYVEEWWSGDENSPKVTIENNLDEVERQPIYNFLTRIDGVEQSAAKVVVGNHRDSWCFGAVDPGSGTAIMMEVSRIFNELLVAGWRPARTIEFASWDGGEFNMLGSTEHVEANVEDIRQNTFAYVNVDAGVFGPDFRANASPIMENILLSTIERVGPNTESGTTLRQLWEQKQSKLEGLGGGSDYAAFQNIAGVPSIDMGFTGPWSYPKRSCFDTFELMNSAFDSDFRYHKLLAQVIALMVYELADSPVVGFDFDAYAKGIGEWTIALDKIVKSKNPPMDLDLGPLDRAHVLMQENGQMFHRYQERWDKEVAQFAGYEPNPMRAERIQYNDRAMNFDKHFLDLKEGGGLSGRTQFKHVLFAPDKSNAEGVTLFPGVMDAVEAGDTKTAKAKLHQIVEHIANASVSLIKDLDQ